jgi:hypothetical protein
MIVPKYKLRLPLGQVFGCAEEVGNKGVDGDVPVAMG